MMFFKNLVLGLGALVVGLFRSALLCQTRVRNLHLFGISSCSPYAEYLALLIFASFARRLATKSSDKFSSAGIVMAHIRELRLNV